MVSERWSMRSQRLSDIMDFLNTPLPEDWKDWSLKERQAFWTSSREGGTEMRLRVCAKEIWRELYQGDMRTYDRNCALLINKYIRESSEYWKEKASIDCGRIYGRQRAFQYDFAQELADHRIALAEYQKASCKA